MFTHTHTNIVGVFDEVTDDIGALRPHIHCTIAITRDQVSVGSLNATGDKPGPEIVLQRCWGILRFRIERGERRRDHAYTVPFGREDGDI